MRGLLTKEEHEDNARIIRRAQLKDALAAAAVEWHAALNDPEHAKAKGHAKTVEALRNDLLRAAVEYAEAT